MNPSPSPHRIRLRPAWQYCGGAVFDQARSQRVEVPDRRTPQQRVDQAQAVYRRSFNRPTGLQPQSRVWLVFTAVEGTGAARLNGRPIGTFDASADGSPACGRFEVTRLLQNANVIEVTLAASSPALLCLSGEVRLEIESTGGA